jgi:hypothetical protein
VLKCVLEVAPSWACSNSGLLLLACNGVPLLSHAQTAPSIQPQTAPMRDPVRAEIQPRLDADRDPIPSPDLEDNAPANAASPLAPAKFGDIQKLKDGIYTMHQGVDEVLLQCAAVDDKGRLVTDLNRGDFRVWEDGVPQTTTRRIVIRQTGRMCWPCGRPRLLHREAGARGGVRAA